MGLKRLRIPGLEVYLFINVYLTEVTNEISDYMIEFLSHLVSGIHDLSGKMFH